MSFQRFLAACVHFANQRSSGIPVVKISPESERTKDAIAKARKAVEEDQKDDAAKEVEIKKKEQDPEVETSEKVEENVKGYSEASTISTKREREEDAEVSEAKKNKADAEV